MKNVWKWKFSACHLDYIQFKWALNIVNYIGICMLKWLFARNDVIIEKAMSHILRTRQAFDLRVFLFIFKSGVLSKYFAPKKTILPFQFPFKPHTSEKIRNFTSLYKNILHEVKLHINEIKKLNDFGFHLLIPSLFYWNSCVQIWG